MSTCRDFLSLHDCGYEYTNLCCVSQGNVETSIRRGDNSVSILLQVNSSICTPKMLKSNTRSGKVIAKVKRARFILLHRVYKHYAEVLSCVTAVVVFYCFVKRNSSTDQ